MVKVTRMAGKLRLEKMVLRGVLPQNLPLKTHRTAYEVVSVYFPRQVNCYGKSHTLTRYTDEASLERMMKAPGSAFKVLMAGALIRKLQQFLRNTYDPDQRLNTLSGGWQRRVRGAGYSVVGPSPPTILCACDSLVGGGASWCNAVCEPRSRLYKTYGYRVVELDRGKLVEFCGFMDRYLELKEKALEEEERETLLLDKRLKQEETWIRQGIKARRTRTMAG